MMGEELPLGKIISLLSGSGGTGRSGFAAGTALALARDGHRVLCVDLQAGFGALDIYLGMEQLDCLSYADICRGDYPLSRAAAHPKLPNLHFLAAPLGQERLDPRAFAWMLHQTKAEFDFIFLDAPVGLQELSEMAAEEADKCLIFCGIDPISIRAAGRLADRLQLMGKPDARLIVNRVHPGRLRAMKMNIDDIIDRVGIPLMGLIPEEEQVLLSLASDKFWQEKRGAFAAYRRISQRLQGLPVPVSIR